MRRAIASGAFGALFGAGLFLSGMLDPAKVLGFLDVAGRWNPQLAFVMGGAIAAALPAFRLARRRERALLGDPIRLPGDRGLDERLIGGAALFGLGWGLVGICPGPAVVLAGFAGPAAWLFLAAMIAGLLIARAAGRTRAAAPEAEAAPGA